MFKVKVEIKVEDKKFEARSSKEDGRQTGLIRINQLHRCHQCSIKSNSTWITRMKRMIADINRQLVTGEDAGCKDKAL